jgi:glycerol-1-phosphate dehydrogenase [NAD(P)+]
MGDFDALLDGSLPRAMGVADVFRLRHVELRPGASAAVGEWVSARVGGPVLVVADVRTRAAAGAPVLDSLARAGVDAVLHIVPDSHNGESPSADSDAVERVQAALRGAAAKGAVAVGSGTVTDLTKMAATRELVPWVSVPTAPSMNGYTSAIAAILVRGVKRTLPAHQASAVFADLDVLSRAPAQLVQAGFADLSSKPFSNACWILSSVFASEPYRADAAKLLDGPFRRLLAAAEGVGARSAAAMEQLANTVLLSGCSMALAGTSSPASGGEHLVSHYWDMVEHAAHRPVRALHGLQVGVATVLSARLYEKVLAFDWSKASLDDLSAQQPADGRALEALVRSRHPALPTDIVDELVVQSLGKFAPPPVVRARLAAIAEQWSSLQSRLSQSVLGAEEMVRALRAVGAPTQASDLGVDLPTLRHTVLVCRDIRQRYTILDFANDLGILAPFCASL